MSKKKKCKECGKSFVDLEGHVARMHAGYEVEISVNDVEYTAHGETVSEALMSFINSNEFPFGAKTPAMFRVRKDGKEAFTKLYPARARRMFLNLKRSPSVVDVFAAQLERHLNA